MARGMDSAATGRVGIMHRVESLEQLSAAVRAAIGSGATFSYLNARLLIQLGVNLKDISPAQNHNPHLLQQVTEALGRMGIHWEKTQ
jgi:hypothetical protein